MKIALLYIGVGRYVTFWDEFYKSCEQNFMPEIEKHYFFVTDVEKQMKVNNNVTLIHQDDLGWPCNVLFKYMYFLRIKLQLQDYDFIYLCNANMQFLHPISSEILPSEEDGWLTMLTWQEPDTNPDTYPFERRTNLASYVPFGTKQIYYQAGSYGGRQKEFLELFDECHQLTIADFKNGYVPLWHDESVLNRYMVGRKCKVLDNTYGQPEHRDKKHTAKIIFRDKETVLGRSYMRDFKKRPHTNTWLRKLLSKIGLA